MGLNDCEKNFTRDEVSCERTACAIYTSGSTGKPKGVLLSHKSLVNRLHWMKEAFTVQSDEVFVQKTGLNFVDHVAEILQPLVQGTPLVILSEDQAKDIESLAEAIHRHRITRITLVPSLLRLLIEHTEAAKLASLRYINSSGEALGCVLARQVKALLPNVKLINLYGSTEVSADVTYAVYDESNIELDIVSIGKPIANSEVYVLGSEQQLLPLGAKGELYVSGACLAQGYLNREKEQSESFVSHVFKNGERMYRTGDIVRWLPNGELHYLGREDDQIKLRGMRLEAGEVEAQLKQLPQIREVAVGLSTVRHLEDKRLVAYIVLQDQLVQDALEQHEKVRQDQAKNLKEKYRKALREKLPEHMVPELYVFLDNLPLTSTGKVNRKALPIPKESDIPQSTYVAPRNIAETILCQLWQDILKVDRVGIEDNFFELGGHSLLATRLMSAVRSALQLDIPLRVLFDQPTVAGLTENRANWRQRDSIGAPISFEASEFPRLSFAQERMLFVCSIGGYGGYVYNMPMAYKISGDLDVGFLTSAIRTVVGRHNSLRTVFDFSDSANHSRQRILSDSQIPIEVVSIDEEELCSQVEKGVEHVFDLSKGPLILIKIFEISNREYVLFINVHHINFDGWSVGIMLDEISTFYFSLLKDRMSGIKALPAQYLDYSLWQRESMAGPDFNGHAEYWRRQLANPPKPITLPFADSSLDFKSNRGDLVEFSIDELLAKRIQTTTGSLNSTPYMYFLSIFYVMLWQLSGKGDIVIGAPTANRNLPWVENIIGLFFNILPLRMSVSSDSNFYELLGKVKKMTMDAYEHQEYPFEKIVEMANPGRVWSQNPFFKIMINFNNFKSNRLILGDAKIEVLPLKWRAAKMDLSLNINETSEHCYVGSFEYSVDVFERKEIVAMKDHFMRLLDASFDLISNPIFDFPVPSVRSRSHINLFDSEEDIMDLLSK